MLIRNFLFAVIVAFVNTALCGQNTHSSTVIETSLITPSDELVRVIEIAKKDYYNYKNKSTVEDNLSLEYLLTFSKVRDTIFLNIRTAKHVILDVEMEWEKLFFEGAFELDNSKIFIEKITYDIEDELLPFKKTGDIIKKEVFFDIVPSRYSHRFYWGENKFCLLYAQEPW